MFLRGYALYLAGEKRREDVQIEPPASSGGGAAKSGAAADANSELKLLYRQLSDAHNDSGSLDGFGLYLFGIVLRFSSASVPPFRSFLVF